MWTSKQSLAAVLTFTLSGVIALWAAPNQALSAEDLPDAKVGQIVCIPVTTTAQENWVVDKIDPPRVYQRDTNEEQKKFNEWKKTNKIVPGGKYMKYFCFRAMQSGNAIIILRSREVNTGKERTYTYNGKVLK